MCVFKYHDFIFFMRPPRWRYGTTPSAWAGRSGFELSVDRFGGVPSPLYCTSYSLGSSTCHWASLQENTYWQRIWIINRSPRLTLCRPKLLQILSPCVLSATPHPCCCLTRVDNDNHFASFFATKLLQTIIVFRKKWCDYRDNHYFAKN